MGQASVQAGPEDDGQGGAAFDSRVDLNPDGCVDGTDLALMASVWGRVFP